MTRGDLIMKRLLSLLLTAALLALALPVLADGDATDAQGNAEVVDDANSTSTDADSPATDSSTDADSAVTDSDASNAGTAITPTPLSEANADDATLVNAARDAVDQLYTLFSDPNYVNLYTSGSNISTMIAEAMDQDYSAPDSIVVLSMPLDTLDAVISMIFSAGDAPYDAQDAQMRRIMRLKMYNMLPSLLNSRAGAEWLAATSVMTLGDIQVLDGVSPRVAYVIFDYGAERPAAIVAAHIDEEGLTSLATTLCKLPDELRTPLLIGQIGQLLTGMTSNATQALDDVEGMMTCSIYALDEQ